MVRRLTFTPENAFADPEWATEIWHPFLPTHITITAGINGSYSRVVYESFPKAIEFAEEITPDEVTVTNAPSAGMQVTVRNDGEIVDEFSIREFEEGREIHGIGPRSFGGRVALERTLALDGIEIEDVESFGGPGSGGFAIVSTGAALLFERDIRVVYHLNQFIFADGTVQSLVHGVPITGTEGDDSLAGFNTDDRDDVPYDDLLYGRGGDDTLVGGHGDDTLIGGPGANRMFGGKGDDVYILRPGDGAVPGESPRNGLITETAPGDGVDTIRIEGISPQELRITFIPNLYAFWLPDGDGGHTVQMVEEGNLRGTQFWRIFERIAFDDGTVWTEETGLRAIMLESDSQFYGTSADDRIEGRTGDDTLIGNLGDDLILGGAGDDLLSGGKGADTLRGGNGADTLSGDDGDDLLRGGPGDDRLSGGRGTDRLFGDGGDDTIQGSSLGGTLNGGAGDDSLQGLGREDSLIGGKGDDSIRTGGGADFASGGSGHDMIHNQGGDDTLRGNAGNDEMISLGGQAIMSGGLGADTMTGGGGRDLMNGDRGNDSLTGGGGADTLDGGAGADMVLGFEGTDLLIGGAGHDSLDGHFASDTLMGGAGNDTLTGGSGRDHFVFDLTADPVQGRDVITDYRKSRDTLSFTGLTAEEVTLRRAGFFDTVIEYDGGRVLVEDRVLILDDITFAVA